MGGSYYAAQCGKNTCELTLLSRRPNMRTMEFQIQAADVEESPLFIEQAFNRLLQAIATGELKPGQRIRQAALASQLNISRQPISHALQLLKHEGLVRDAGRQGVEVAPIDPEYMRQLYQARKALEVAAAGLAAQRVADRNAPLKDIEALRKAVEHGKQAYDEGGPVDVLVRADYDFHTALYQLSGNTAIAQMLNARWAHVMRSMLVALDDPDTPGRAWEEHDAIADAVLSGNVLEATELAARHLQRASTEMYQRLTEVVASAAAA